MGKLQYVDKHTDPASVVICEKSTQRIFLWFFSAKSLSHVLIAKDLRTRRAVKFVTCNDRSKNQLGMLTRNCQVTLKAQGLHMINHQAAGTLSPALLGRGGEKAYREAEHWPARAAEGQRHEGCALLKG